MRPAAALSSPGTARSLAGDVGKQLLIGESVCLSGGADPAGPGPALVKCPRWRRKNSAGAAQRSAALLPSPEAASRPACAARSPPS